jgi:hypothetical protein
MPFTHEQAVFQPILGSTPFLEVSERGGSVLLGYYGRPPTGPAVFIT